MKHILVTGATGNIGSKIIALLKHNHSLRTISRDPNAANRLREEGIDARVGDLSDKAFVVSAFEGIDTAFLMLPPNYAASDLRKEQQTITENYVAAIQAHQPNHIVCLSSVGAHLSEGAGIIAPLYDLEQALKKVSPNVVFLRPSYFMENLFNQIGVIKTSGIMAASIRKDLKLGFVAVQDIAAVAASYLEEDFVGQKVQFVLGPEDLTYAEVASVIGRVIGKPDLPYVELSREAFHKASLELGMPPAVVDGLSEYLESSNQGLVGAETVRDERATTPTTIQAFAKTFAQVYQGS